MNYKNNFNSSSSDFLLQKYLDLLDKGWKVNQLNHLYKEYITKDFISAISLANQVAVPAEKFLHHPDLKISYGKCVIELWTHDLNTLTEKDFVLAKEIEFIATNFIDI
jgi:4a-hydroxytetrahydrobiopterin dehydratase